MIEATEQYAADTVLPTFRLVGRKAFVTGGSRGIGRACALALASAGADVAIGSSPAGVESAAGVRDEIRRMGRRAEIYSFDVCVAEDVASVCARVNREFEGIDVLVNNAGIARDRSFRKMDQ